MAKHVTIENNRKAMLARYHERRAQGLCTRCGRVNDTSKTACRECRSEMAKLRHMGSGERLARIDAVIAAEPRCTHCGLGGHTVAECDLHITRFVRRSIDPFNGA